jgi:dsRNA-specific ribonuclease
MGEGDLKLGIQNEPSVMEDLFESIVGAIFIDSDMNMQSVIKAISGMLDMSVYTDRQKISQSAKNALQEWCADKKRRLPAPRYETLSEDGPDHKKTYMRGCYIGDRLMGRGIGKNFKLADAAAAEDALKVLMAQNERNMQSKIDKSAQNSQANTKEKKDASPTNNTKSTIETAAANDVAAPKEKVVASYATLLKNYSVSNKKSSPVFRDLGERKNGKKTECAVECSFMDAVATGVGPTRPEAREAACKLIAEKLGIGKKRTAKKASTPTKTDKNVNSAKNNVPSGAKATAKRKNGKKNTQVKAKK